MPNRLQRTMSPFLHAQRIDKVMLPAVTLLMLVGASFVLIAWALASDNVDDSRRRDEVRAERLAASIREVIEFRWSILERWATTNDELMRRGSEFQLGQRLQQRLASDAADVTAAWVVIRGDGSVAAVGESAPGTLATDRDTFEDVRKVGRAIVTSGRPGVSGAVRIGDETAVAIGVPLDTDGDRKLDSSLLAISYLQQSEVGAFLHGDRSTGAVEAARLIDTRGITLMGRARHDEADHVHRRVSGTEWFVELSRARTTTFLPIWAYPLFAVLLGAFTIAYALQDITRRRLRREADHRALQVHALYDLAERALHARTVEEQAEDLARTALDLAKADCATVHVRGVDGEVVRTAGTASGRGRSKYRVPIVGPRDPVGELVVAHDGRTMDEEEAQAIETAATLVGAAMHTLGSLATERAAAAELQRLDELRSNLLTTVAHELLSPLTAVKGVLGLLSMQDDLGERGQEYVGVATERTDRLVALIRDLFDCSLLETGQLDIRPRRQRADELLESALGAQAAARPGELVLSATPQLEITVDPVRFDQLVNNLVANAFRHGRPPIEVAVRPADGGAIVVVSDEGKGIALEDRSEVFDKFWQGSSGHARTAQGAGLGLNLVQGLVRVHGGDIRVDSTHADGRGARFTAFFPDVVPSTDGQPGDPSVPAPSLA